MTPPPVPLSENLPQVDGAYDDLDDTEVEQAVPVDAAHLVHEPVGQSEEAVVPCLNIHDQIPENMENSHILENQRINVDIAEGVVELPDESGVFPDETVEIPDETGVFPAETVEPSNGTDVCAHETVELPSDTSQLNVVPPAEDSDNVPMEVSADIDFDVIQEGSGTGFLEVVPQSSPQGNLSFTSSFAHYQQFWWIFDFNFKLVHFETREMF